MYRFGIWVALAPCCVRSLANNAIFDGLTLVLDHHTQLVATTARRKYVGVFYGPLRPLNALVASVTTCLVDTLAFKRVLFD